MLVWVSSRHTKAEKVNFAKMSLLHNNDEQLYFKYFSSGRSTKKLKIKVREYWKTIMGYMCEKWNREDFNNILAHK